MKMSLIIIFTFLSILFSYHLLPPSCASLQTHLQPSLFQQQQQANAHHQHLFLPRLVRKIRVAEKVRGYSEGRDLAPSHKQKKNLSGMQHHMKKQSEVLGKRETRKEWVDYGEDPSQYFAKDYNHVGRRRPIHN